MTARTLAASIAAPCAVAFGAAGCARGCSISTPDPRADFGQVSAPAPPPDAIAPYLAMARRVLEHAPGSAAAGDANAPRPPLPGRRVFLTAWPRAHAGPDGARVATGSGATLSSAVAAAADALASQSPPWPIPPDRLELDVATSAEPASLDDSAMPLRAIGLVGVLAARGGASPAFVLPSEIHRRGLFRSGKDPGVDAGRIRALLATREAIPESALAGERAWRFTTAAYAETPDRANAVRVVRGMVEAPRAADVDVARLLDAARRGGEYLVRSLGPQGRYAYLVHPADGRADGTYGWLRHAGATYALFEAYEEFQAPEFLEAGRRALEYLRRRLVDDAATHGQMLFEVAGEEEQKVGGAGLALVAWAQYASVTGDRSDLETMRALARFIVGRQYPDGHYRANADVDRETGSHRKTEPIYYTGEATLGLVRLYALDPQPAVLDAARRAAAWIINVRDAGATDETREHDHWMAYALADLYRLTRDESYAAQAFAIARAIATKQYAPGRAPAADWIGAFYEGQSTPASTRLEAYDSAIALSRQAGTSDAWIVAPARDVAAFTLGNQFGDANDYWLPHPEAMDGGVREGVYAEDVRIDYVQHAMSAWIHLARLLRENH